jgi:PPM family protein phosphatase
MLRIAEQWHASDLGRQRQGNEDSYFARAPLFVVADGMGGAQAGEVASAMAVESFQGGLPDGNPAESLVTVIEEANRRIHERSRTDEQRAGMGTTVTAAYVGEDAVTVAHVGDSRCYLLRDGDLVRLTRDHSLVGELVARGKLTEEQAEAHPQRSVITRALGPEPRVEVDVDVFPARDGDVFLVCSDGLTSMVHEPRLKPLVTSGGPLSEIGQKLIAAANEAGGRDNITVILFRLEEVHSGAEAASAAALADEDTSEYETFEGDAVPAPRQGVTRPHALASDEQEAEYRASGTVALSAVRPRMQPIDERRGPPPRLSAPPRRRRRLLRAGPIIAVLVVIGVLIAAWTATREVYFLGTDPAHADVVTIYRGLPYDLPLGVRLYSPVARSGVTLQSVAPGRRKTFTDHQLRSRKEAVGLLLDLETGQLR